MVILGIVGSSRLTYGLVISMVGNGGPVLRFLRTLCGPEERKALKVLAGDSFNDGRTEARHRAERRTDMAPLCVKTQSAVRF